MTRLIAFLLCVLGLLPAPAAAQSSAGTGARAAGMGGAFTAMADDASAVYWNPAGLAAGAIVSVVVDLGQASASPSELGSGHDRSSFLLAVTTPAVGLGYYRLRSTTAAPGIRLLPEAGSGPAPGPSVVGQFGVESLVTHHAGVTLVQSIIQGVAVGSTLKFVRGIAASQSVLSLDPEAALDAGSDLLGRATNRFDLDAGVMVYGGPFKAGLTVRNVLEPEFPTAGDGSPELVLERQTRAGLAYMISSQWVAAADFDLMKTADVYGDRRDAAFGAEGQVIRQVWVRSGFRFNTAGDDDRIDDARAAAYSIGGSYAPRAGILIDGHFTTGSGRAGREWGVAARFVY